MTDVVLVFFGGGIGATLRYWLSGTVHRFLGADFPFGTMLVNLVGSFAIGFLMSFFEERFVVQSGLRLFLTIGILGGFTTFSTFSFETIALMREANYLQASVNIGFTILLCLGGCWMGSVLGRAV